MKRELLTDLARIKALDAKASPAPWRREPAVTNIECPARNAGCVTADYHLALIFSDGGIGKDQAEANAAFIAAARTAVPDMIEIVEAAVDHVALWQAQKISGASRAERNAAIEESRSRLIAACEKVRA